MMKLKIFNQNIAEINTYLLSKKKEAVVIDPGFNGDKILQYCEDNGIQIRHVILTHGHFDHIKSVEKLAVAHDFDVRIGQPDLNALKDDTINYAKSFGQTFRMPESTRVIPVIDGDRFNLLDEEFIVISTPGHTKGSICIAHANWLFTGDTLFSDTVGRTDLVTGSYNDMMKSIEKLKKTISNQVMVYPGHGANAEMKTIKQNNRFMK